MLALLGSLKKAGVTPPPDPNLITNSLRFRRTASANLTRTFGTPTNASVYTWSGWVKRGQIGLNISLFGTSSTTYLRFTTSNAIALFINNVQAVLTTAVFRDQFAWYHVVYSQNETSQTIYVNGNVVGTGTTAPAAFNTNIAHSIGSNGGSNFFDGYLTEVNFIDGQALTESSFGEINSTTGVWSPKQYTGTYGNNGFRLRFNSTSSLAALGTDSSGNNNTWTVSNVSLTAGVTYDSMIDVPVNYSDDGNGRGNYAVLNGIVAIPNAVPNAGNLESQNLATAVAVGSILMDSGSWYWETQYNSAVADQIIGIYKSPTVTATTATITPTTSVIGLRFNADTGALDYTVDGTTYTSIATGLTGGGYVPYAASATNAKIIYVNFGQRPFAYTRPVGFNALNTNSLPVPSIINSANYMAVNLYTGNETIRSINNTVNSVSFQPDLVWIKARNATTNHVLFDSVRGAERYVSSNTTTPETINANTLTGFNSNGFNLGIDNTLTNATGVNYFAWQWKKGIVPGLDIVSYTGTGVVRTVSHNLGIAPSMIIIKRVSAGANENGIVYHKDVSANNSLILNDTFGALAGSWNNTAPTSTEFTIAAVAGVNTSGVNYIAYCFAEIPGFSKFTKYPGNDSATRPFTYCNFSPKFFLLKEYTSGFRNRWVAFDAARGGSFSIAPNDAGVDSTAVSLQITSNGFKLLSTGSSPVNLGTVLVAAFAEAPFKYALAKF
jgi:hypothetical protein